MQRILVMFDRSKMSIKALDYALALVGKKGIIDLICIVDSISYKNIIESVRSFGGDEHEVERVLREMEHRFRKQVNIFVKECKDYSICVNTIFKVGEVESLLLKELSKGRYDLVIIPCSPNYRDRAAPILSKLVQNYRGNILIIK